MKGSRFILGFFVLLAILGAWLAWETGMALRSERADTPVVSRH